MESFFNTFFSCLKMKRYIYFYQKLMHFVPLCDSRVTALTPFWCFLWRSCACVYVRVSFWLLDVSVQSRRKSERWTEKERGREGEREGQGVSEALTAVCYRASAKPVNGRQTHTRTSTQSHPHARTDIDTCKDMFKHVRAVYLFRSSNSYRHCGATCRQVAYGFWFQQYLQTFDLNFLLPALSPTPSPSLLPLKHCKLIKYLTSR